MGGDLGGAVKGFKKAINDDVQKNDEVVEDVEKSEAQKK